MHPDSLELKRMSMTTPYSYPLMPRRQHKTRSATLTDSRISDIARAHMIRWVMEGGSPRKRDELELQLAESLELPIDDDVQAFDAIHRGFDKALQQIKSALAGLI